MKIQLASDIHLRPGDQSFDFPEADSDILILAGDIGHGTRAIEFAQHIADKHQKNVIFLAGNHEYYFGNYVELQESFRNFSDKSQNVHYLERDVFVHQDTRFIGATLWTDYRLDGRFEHERLMEVAGNMLSDHVYIKFGLEGTFMPKHALALHLSAREFLEKELAKPFDGKTVVVTHHAPSLVCEHPKFGIDPLSGAFISDCDELIAQADLWVFGHTHANVDTKIGKCRLVSNQVGYSSEQLKVPYRPDLVIEI